jgi:hypothetical protein
MLARQYRDLLSDARKAAENLTHYRCPTFHSKLFAARSLRTHKARNARVRELIEMARKA